MLIAEKIDKKLFSLIKDCLYCFGPSRYGPNLFLIRGLNPELSLYNLYNSPTLEDYTQKL